MPSIRIGLLFRFTGVFSLVVSVYRFFIWRMNLDDVAVREAWMQLADPSLFAYNVHAAEFLREILVTARFKNY